MVKMDDPTDKDLPNPIDNPDIPETPSKSLTIEEQVANLDLAVAIRYMMTDR